MSRLLAFFRQIYGRFFSDSSIGLGKITPQGVGAVTRQYRMNYFDPAENSNKVWIGIAYSDGSFETQFGRVRDDANLASSKKKFPNQYAAENELERKRREKLRKGYKDTVVVDNAVATTLNKNKRDDLVKIAAEQIDGAADDSVTSELIKYLAEVNIHHITHSTSIKYNTKTGAFSSWRSLAVNKEDQYAKGDIWWGE